MKCNYITSMSSIYMGTNMHVMTLHIITTRRDKMKITIEDGDNLSFVIDILQNIQELNKKYQEEAQK